MPITLDQAHAIDAVATSGTFQGAAKRLGKGHSAVLYLIKSLEEETGLALFDRSGYRSKLNENGEVVLKLCRRLLLAADDVQQTCHLLGQGWEPRVRLVYDGVINFNIIGNALQKVQQSAIPTEVSISSAYLDEVEQQFLGEKADFMLTILTMRHLNLPSLKLNSFPLLLVAGSNHLLCKKSNNIKSEELSRHTFIRVRGSTQRLDLSTSPMDKGSLFLVNDFYTKKQAILAGLGYGWMPKYLIEQELKKGIIRELKGEIDSQILLKPRLYHRKTEHLGKGAKVLLESFAG